MFLKNKKIFGVISLVVLVAMVTFGLNFDKAEAASINRLGGQSRIDTANKVAKDIFKTSDAVILVNGYGYADAVSAAPLSKLINAPVLLTQNGSNLEASVIDTIKSLGAKKVHIIGGTGVVSSRIEGSLRSKGYSTSRYSGQDRFETNAKVAKEVLRLSPSTNKAILVNGQDGYADSLSVASMAAMKKYPVLFATATKVQNVTKKVINDNDLDILAVGGSGVLPTSVVNTVNGTKITKDADCKNRFATNLAVLNYFKGKGLDISKVYVAAGGQAGSAGKTQFADALVASAAAAKTGAPLVLTGLGANQESMVNADKFVQDNVSKSSSIFIVGGTGSVSQSIENNLVESVGDFTVISID